MQGATYKLISLMETSGEVLLYPVILREFMVLHRLLTWKDLTNKLSIFEVLLQ